MLQALNSEAQKRNSKRPEGIPQRSCQTTERCSQRQPSGGHSSWGREGGTLTPRRSHGVLSFTRLKARQLCVPWVQRRGKGSCLFCRTQTPPCLISLRRREVCPILHTATLGSCTRLGVTWGKGPAGVPDTNLSASDCLSGSGHSSLLTSSVPFLQPTPPSFLHLLLPPDPTAPPRTLFHCGSPGPPIHSPLT